MKASEVITISGSNFGPNLVPEIPISISFRRGGIDYPCNVTSRASDTKAVCALGSGELTAGDYDVIVTVANQTSAPSPTKFQSSYGFPLPLSAVITAEQNGIAYIELNATTWNPPVEIYLASYPLRGELQLDGTPLRRPTGTNDIAIPRQLLYLPEFEFSGNDSFQFYAMDKEFSSQNNVGSVKGLKQRSYLLGHC